MAVKKTINTFEGGIDQDTDVKLVKNNTMFSLANGTLTKDGKQGVISTYKGFNILNSNSNINEIDQNEFGYEIKLDNTILQDKIILSYNDGGTITSIVASKNITSIQDLILELRLTFNENQLITYNNLTTAYLYFNNIQVIRFNFIEYTYEFEIASTINIGETLFEYREFGSTFTTTVTAFQNISDSTDLKNELDTLVGSPFTLTDFFDSLFIKSNDVDLININPKLINFAAPTVTVFDEINLLNSFLPTTEFTNLGVKEIALKNNLRLIFLFKKDVNNIFYIQLIYYNSKSKTFLESFIVYKGNISVDIINEDNIILSKEFENKYKIYWCDGINPDKFLDLDLDLDYNNYVSINDFKSKIRNLLFLQSNNKFNELRNDFFPKPELYDLIIDNTNGKVKSKEVLVFFYRLKKGSVYSNISVFSDYIYISKNGFYNSIENLIYSDSTNKFISSFTVKNLNSEYYDFIQGYVVHYNQDKSTYKIRSLPEQNITEKNLVFIYNEDYDNSDLVEIDLENILQFDNLNDISQEQIIYKNRRLKANLKNTTLKNLLDFDSRAYRFDSTKEAVLYDKNGSIEITIDGASPNYNIDEKLDLINKYNDEYSDNDDWSTNQQYKFKADGATLGGEGKNISYTFSLSEVGQTELNDINNLITSVSSIIESRSGTNNLYKTLPSGKKIYNSHRNPSIEKGFMGGEVYRFFIYFWKGDTPTLAKWIGDIKFPENSQMLYRDFDGLTTFKNPTNCLQMGIDFDVDTSSINKEVTAISIGYVPRKDSDKSVIITNPNLGLHYSKYNNDLLYRSSITEAVQNFTVDDGLTTDETEDVTELKKVITLGYDIIDYNILNVEGQSDYYLKRIPQAGIEYRAFSGLNDSPSAFDNMIVAHSIYVNKPFSPIDGVYPIRKIKSIKSLEDEILLNDILTLNIANTKLRNVSSYVDTGAEIIHPNKTKDLVEGSDFKKTVFILEESFDNRDGGIMSLRKKVMNQYNGNSYNSRLSNEVEIGSYTDIRNLNSVSIRPQGDSYTGMYDILTFWHKTGDSNGSGGFIDVVEQKRAIYYPIETHYNLHSLDNTNSSKTRPYDYSYVDYTNVFSNNTLNNKIKFENIILKNITFSYKDFTYVNTNLLLISDKKILGQTYDTWNTFIENNSKIIDPNWGAITKLIDEKDRLFIFQENAVAQQYVDQVQQNINDISEVVLGTGDVAGQHIYILKNMGVQKNNDIIQLNNDIIFKDSTRNQLFSLNNGEIRGVSNVLTNDSYQNVGRKLIYDRESNVVFIPNYIDYNGTINSKMISYNNNIGLLESTDSLIADINQTKYFTGLTNFLKIDNGILSFFNSSNFINTSQLSNPFSLSFIVNVEPNKVKTFDNLFLDYEVYSYVDGLPVDIFNFKPEFIQIETQYQDTGLINVTNNNFKRRGRYWNFVIPREKDSINRIRDYYAKITITFPSINDKEIKINSITTSYRDSNLK